MGPLTLSLHRQILRLHLRRRRQPHRLHGDHSGQRNTQYAIRKEGLGYTGEWQDAAVGLVYLRARWYNPIIGIFWSRDPIPLGHPYGYAWGNPIRYTDRSGLWPGWGRTFYPGYIESRVNAPLFGPGTHGQKAWLDAAIQNVSELRDLYGELKEELFKGRFASGTLRDLYIYTRERARGRLSDAFTCIHHPDLEYAHAALIVLAYIPANHNVDIQYWEQYPLFIPDGRSNELGWDKAGHFFLYAFTAFEGKYARKPSPVPMQEYGHIVWMSTVLGWIIGRGNLEAIEADYRANVDAPYLDAGALGLRAEDAALFHHLVTIGNAYELLTSLKQLGRSLEEVMGWMIGDRILRGGRNIEDQVTRLLSQPKVADQNEGLLDVGVNRDQVANRLGIQFGIQVFNNPSVVPVIPHDVGKAGFRCWPDSRITRGEVCYYKFP